MVLGGGGTNLGTATGAVTIDSRGVEEGMRRAQSAFRSGIDGMSRGFSNLSAGLQSVGTNLTLLTAPIAAFGVQGVAAASRFESALVEIQARAGLTEDQLEAVRQKALDIGRDTAFSAGQGAEAFLQLLTTGQSVEEAFATIDQVITGAAAAGTELGFTADALTDIMAQFSTQGADSVEVLDALARASGSSSATMTDLVQGFQNAGGVASSFGLSVEETAAILAVFSENGIKGAEAGTQLRSMLNNMTRDTEETRAAWDELGISMFDATGQARPLGDVMQDLRTALSNVNQETRIRLVAQLAGTYGQLGLNALTTGESLEDMQDKMRDAASAAEVADARMNTFSGSITFLKGSVETFQIQVLTPFMQNTLRPLVLRISDVVNALTQWAQANPELTEKIVRMVAAVVSLGPTLFLVGKAMTVVGSIIGTLLSPIGLVIAAIAALKLAFDVNLFGIRDVVTSAFNGARVAIQNFLDILSGSRTAEEFSARIDEIFGDSVIGRILRFIGAFKRVISIFIQDISNVGIGDAIRNIFGADDEGRFTIEATGEAFLVMIGMSRQAARQLLTDLAPAVDAILDRISATIPVVVEFARQLVSGLITNGLAIVSQFVSAVVIPGFDFLKTLFLNFWSDVSPALAQLVEWFTNTGLPLAQQAIQENIIPAFAELRGAVQNMVLAVLPFLSDLLSWFIGSGLPVILEFILGTAIPAFAEFASFIADVINNVVTPVLVDLLTFFRDSVVPALVDTINNDVLPIIDLMGIFFEALWNERLKPTWEALTEVIPALWRDRVQPALDMIVLFFTDIGFPAIISFLNDVFLAAWNNFVDVIKSIWALVQGDLEAFEAGVLRIFGRIKGIIDEVIGAVGDFVEALDGISIPSFLQGEVNIPGVGNINPLAMGMGGIVTEPTAAIVGDSVPGSSFEAVLNEPQLRRLISEVAAMSGDTNIIIPGANNPTVTAEAVNSRLKMERRRRGLGTL